MVNQYHLLPYRLLNDPAIRQRITFLNSTVVVQCPQANAYPFSRWAHTDQITHMQLGPPRVCFIVRKYGVGF